DVLASKESSPGVFLQLGRAQLNANGGAAAIPILERGYALYQAMAHPAVELGNDLRYNLGLAYSNAGDAARAVEYLNAVTPGEDFLDALDALARAYTKRGDNAKAYEAFTRIVAVEPTPEREAALAAAAKAAGHSAADAETAVWVVRDALAKPAPDF